MHPTTDWTNTRLYRKSVVGLGNKFLYSIRELIIASNSSKGRVSAPGIWCRYRDTLTTTDLYKIRCLHAVFLKPAARHLNTLIQQASVTHQGKLTIIYGLNITLQVFINYPHVYSCFADKYVKTA